MNAKYRGSVSRFLKIGGAIVTFVSIAGYLLWVCGFLGEQLQDSDRRSVCLYGILTVVLLMLLGSIVRNVRNKRKGLTPSRLKSYTDIFNSAKCQYWYYGLSGEEWQNEIKLTHFLCSNHEVPKMKVILLHPDCARFRERVALVNQGGDIDTLVKGKRQMISSLLTTVKSLPDHKRENIEICFTTTYPVWILQFVSSNPDQMERVYVKVHLRERHSRKSLMYEARCKSDTFESFKIFFNQEWSNAIPVSSDFTIPVL